MTSLVKTRRLLVLASLIFSLQNSFAQDNPVPSVKLTTINQMAGTWSCESTGSAFLENGSQLDVKETGTEKIDQNGVSHADLTLDTMIMTATAMITQDVATHSDGVYRLQDGKLIDRLTGSELVSFKMDGLQDQAQVDLMRERFVAAMHQDVENKKESTYTVTRFTGDQLEFTDHEESMVVNGVCKRTAP